MFRRCWARQEPLPIALPVVLFGTRKHTLAPGLSARGAGGVAGLLFPSGEIEVYTDHIEEEGSHTLPEISLSRDKIAHVFVAADAASTADLEVLNEYMSAHYSRMVPMTLFLHGTSTDKREFVRKLGPLHKHSITIIENAEQEKILDRLTYVHHRTTVHSTMLVYMGMGTLGRDGSS